MFFGNTDRAMLREILQNTRTTMATVKAIREAVSTIVTDFTTYSTEVDAKLATLQTVKGDDGDNPELDEALKELTDLHASFTPKIVALAATADVPPPVLPIAVDAPVGGTAVSGT